MRTPHTPLALFAAVVAFLLPVVFSPSIQATFWTPAAAICLVVAGVGFVPLVRTARRDRAGAAVAALVAVAFVSAVLAGNRTLSFFGLYGWGTGFLFVLALAGAWAIGRTIPARGASLVERALLAAAIVNAVAAVLEMGLDLSAFQLGKVGGRAIGLLGNSVHLGGFAGAAIVLAGRRFAARPARWAVVPVLLGTAVQVSGSRAGLAIIIAGTAYVALSLGRRLLAVVFATLVIAGVLLGGGLAHIGGGTSVTSRVQEAAGGGGVRARLLTWEAGVRSLPEHPLVGVGPGLFRDATAPRRTVDVAHAEDPEKLFVDAHNLIVEYAVTTGVLGLAALVAWLWLAIRSGRGPLLWFSLLLLVNHLVEPQAVRTTPVLFLALGAAAPDDALRTLASLQRARAAAAVSSALALVAAIVLLVGDFHLEQGRLDFVHSHARAALRMLPHWAEPALLEGRIYLFEERVHRRPEDAAAALDWLRIAAERDRGNPTTWAVLGENLLAQGHRTEGVAALRQSLRANPTSVRALNDLGIEASIVGDTGEAARWFRRSLDLDGNQRSIRRRLDALEGGP
ncbi:MAG TPA: O-antigen ligase family protein [Acidimicrobiales bacterium]|nr:O-antigen ligase family protein [Acidimicrobiales bacterium]